MPPVAAIALLIEDSWAHDVGCGVGALDVKERVAWAWSAVQPFVKSKAVKPLRLDVEAGKVNGSCEGSYAELLRKAATSTGQLLPLVAKSWDSSAPSTLDANITAKLGKFQKLKSQKVGNVVRSEAVDDDSSSCDDEDNKASVAEECSIYMQDSAGAKRAAKSMLVAAIFAAELSQNERAPVLVVGRPPGHHATCCHNFSVTSAPYSSPGGPVIGRTMGGGCFYPSCWLAALHSLREGFANRFAYIDVDAHKPDGIWKEIDHMCKLGKNQLTTLLGGQTETCGGVFFSSIHLNGYPNPGNSEWTSARCKLPRGGRRAFDVQVNEELLPEGVAVGGDTRNKEVLNAFQKWESSVMKDLSTFEPNGVFIGLGFDLHKSEEKLLDKRKGMGISGRHYKDFIGSLPVGAGPFVLTMEGGYTKSAIVDGMKGALAGLKAHSKARQKKLRTRLRLPLKKVASKIRAKAGTKLQARLLKAPTPSRISVSSQNDSRTSRNSMSPKPARVLRRTSSMEAFSPGAGSAMRPELAVLSATPRSCGTPASLRKSGGGVAASPKPGTPGTVKRPTGALHCASPKPARKSCPSPRPPVRRSMDSAATPATPKRARTSGAKLVMQMT